MRLRQIRAEKGISIRQLAEDAGVCTQTIVNAEHGRSEPRPDTKYRIARALRVSVSELDDPVIMLRLSNLPTSLLTKLSK